MCSSFFTHLPKASICSPRHRRHSDPGAAVRQEHHLFRRTAPVATTAAARERRCRWVGSSQRETCIGCPRLHAPCHCRNLQRGGGTAGKGRRRRPGPGGFERHVCSKSGVSLAEHEPVIPTGVCFDGDIFAAAAREAGLFRVCTFVCVHACTCQVRNDVISACDI